MNRQQRRKIQRETKQEFTEQEKLQEWFNSWTPSQQMFHREMIHRIEDKTFKDLEKIMDSCYIAAMLQATELSLEQCEDICRLADEHMIETEKIINKEGEKYYMKLNDESLRNEIREEVKEIIKDNRKINNLEIIRILDKEHDLAIKDYQIICKEAREELGKEVLKDIEKELSDLGKDIPSNAVGEISATLAMEGEHGFELAKPSKSNKKLKIKSIKIEGEYGTYIKDSKGVKTSQNIFKDIKELQLYKENAQTEIENQKDTLKEQIEELQGKLRKLNEDSVREYAFIAEIKEVFNM